MIPDPLKWLQIGQFDAPLIGSTPQFDENSFIASSTFPILGHYRVNKPVIMWQVLVNLWGKTNDWWNWLIFKPFQRKSGISSIRNPFPFAKAVRTVRDQCKQEIFFHCFISSNLSRQKNIVGCKRLRNKQWWSISTILLNTEEAM